MHRAVPGCPAACGVCVTHQRLLAQASAVQPVCLAASVMEAPPKGETAEAVTGSKVQGVPGPFAAFTLVRVTRQSATKGIA